jgi:hypothetical protein
MSVSQIMCLALSAGNAIVGAVSFMNGDEKEGWISIAISSFCFVGAIL